MHHEYQKYAELKKSFKQSNAYSIIPLIDTNSRTDKTNLLKTTTKNNHGCFGGEKGIAFEGVKDNFSGVLQPTS